MNFYSSQIQKGSTGDDVKKWQRYLNDCGYDLDVDGIFGDATKKATLDIQVSNGLAADGIVGDETWGFAGFTKYGGNTSTGSGSTSTGNNSTSANGWTYDDFKYDDFTYKDYEAPDDFKYDEYKESDTVKNAGNALNDHLKNEPGEYKSQWTAQLDALMKQIMGREKFSYNMNEDPIYQQHREKYIQQGKLAMGDTMGQAAAMTGGYGNSWAQSVGQQAYQQSLDNLNDIVPELYAMALDKYTREGQDLLNQYGLVMDREDQDYGRYRDEVGDWHTERDYLRGVYDSERDRDYGQYVDDRNFDYNQYINDKNFAYGQYSDDRNLAYNEYATDKNLSYQQYRDKIADEQWQQQYDESVRQYNETMAFNKSQANKTSGGSSSGGSGGSGSSGGSSSGSGSTGGTGNTGNTGNTTTSAAIPDNVKQKAATFKNNDALNEYLTQQYNAGNITEEQMGQLYIENEISELQKRNWTLVDNGGVNWFWGIDNNATVKDQYGNTYRLDKLVDALVAEGIDKSAAKDYVKKLQKQLGA